MTNLTEWKKLRIRQILMELAVGRVYFEGKRRPHLQINKEERRYYTIQSFTVPNSEQMRELKRLGRKVIVKESRIGEGDNTILFPNCDEPGFRINVYL